MPRNCWIDIGFTLGLLTLLVATAAGTEHPRVVAHFDDPVGDDHGRGTLVYPRDRLFTPGTFDLTAFEVLTQGQDVLFSVTFREPIQPPTSLSVGAGTTLLDLCRGGFCLQNVDIYISREGGGRLWTVPGRRIQAGPPGWNRAVILTPQPRAARALFKRIVTRRLAQAAPDAGRTDQARRRRIRTIKKELEEQVLFPERVRVRGRTLTARVPRRDLGGEPDPSWGYLVVVTGAAFTETLDLAGSFREIPGEGVYVRPVLTFPDQWAFGDRRQRPSDSNVVDYLSPPGTVQQDLLARGAPLPFLRLLPWPAAPGPVASALPLPVVGVEGDLVLFRIPDPTAPPAVGEKARLVDARGETVARLVIVGLGEDEGKARIHEDDGLVFVGQGYRILVP